MTASWLEKGESGREPTALGFKANALDGTNRPCEHKVDKAVALVDFCASKATIESKVVESAMSLCTHCLLTLPEGRLHSRRVMAEVRRVVSALEAKGDMQGTKYRFKQSGPIVPVSWAMRKHLEHLREYLEKARQPVRVFDDDAWIGDVPADRDLSTDANRRTAASGTSGMGGLDHDTGIAWYYEISPRFTSQEDGIVVHITEMLASVISLLMTQAPPGTKLCEKNDNQSALAAAMKGSAKDTRLTDLQLLRRVLLERKGLQTRPEYIASADNKLADHISRGELKEFYAAAREIGMEVKALIKLNGTALGRQIDELLEHFYKRSADGGKDTDREDELFSWLEEQEE